MSTPPTENSNDELQSRLLADLDELCDRFEEAWCNGENPRIEDSIVGLNEPLRTRLLQELVSLEVAYRQEHDQTPDRAEYEARFAEDAAVVREAFDSHGWIDASSVLAETVKLADSPTPSGHLAIRCPSCNVPMEVAVDTSLTELT